MNKKMLFISNIGAKKVGSFSMASIMAAQGMNIEYHLASNQKATTAEQKSADEAMYDIHLHHIDFIRNPLHPGNFKAYHQLVKLIRRERFDIIHCNTPIGGVCGRLAGKMCGVKKVIYQAHGFHFYGGAPKLNWLVYYPIERLLAHWTDALITINQEDYRLAQKEFSLRNHGKVYYIPGVGIDTDMYQNIQVDKIALRNALNLSKEDIVCISMGDLIQRKNYPIAIKAIAACKNSKIKYLICGKGPELENLQGLCRQEGVENQVQFLGFRSDIKELLQISDIFLFTTLQEGMPRSMMEAMASGLPCIASKIRGNVDLIENGVNGFLCDSTDERAFASALLRLAKDAELRSLMGQENLKMIKAFDIKEVIEELKKVYAEVVN